MLKALKKELIFEEGLTDMCHASTILRLDNGEFLSAWFGGTKEGNDDVAIWMAKRKENWSRPRKVASSNEPHWNPVLFQLNENKILLFYKVGQEISKWRTMLCFSLDQGETWSEAKELVTGDRGGRGPVRNKPIRLKNGTILCPGSSEDGIWEAFVDISIDDCESLIKSQSIKIDSITYEKGQRTVKKEESDIPVSEQSFYGRGVIQPTLWQNEDGSVHMLLRSTESSIYKSDSKDFGKTWCSAYKTELPNNNSGIDVVKMDNGLLVLIYNPVGVNWGKRSPISVAVSTDGGQSFQKELDLDTGEGEFAYPAIIAHNNQVFVTYTYQRKSIAFWQIEINE